MISDQPVTGTLVLVVGPSGAGKDTLLDYARHALATDQRFRFARRIITRAPGVGEDHDPVDRTAFSRLVDEGAFCLHWEAHGLHYGLPTTVKTWLDEGRTVVANGSRGVLSEAQRRFSRLAIVNVTAPHQLIAQRLAARAREDSSSIAARLERGCTIGITGAHVVDIENSSTPEVGGKAMIGNLVAIAAGCVPGLWSTMED